MNYNQLTVVLSLLEHRVKDNERDKKKEKEKELNHNLPVIDMGSENGDVISQQKGMDNVHTSNLFI